MSDIDDQSSKPDGESEGGPKKPAIAVALANETGSGRTPHVVASGKGAIAEQILRLAFEHGVKVREDADLAEILSVVDVESEIPLEALAAVAEILSYVYRANNAAEPSPDDTDGNEDSSP